MDSSLNDQLTSVVTLYKQGRHREAVDSAQRVLEHHPHDGKLWELCGMAYHALDQNADAIRSLETATTLVPLSAAGQCVLARCYSRSGFRDLARDMYRYLASLDALPDKLLPVVASGLGNLGELELALQLCRRAALCELDSGQPWYGMAHYMGRLGYPLERVASMLRNAVELEPDCFQYRFALASAYEFLGRLDEACDLLREVAGSDRLRGIRCANCLQRMEAIFTAAGQQQLSQACRKRREAIEASQS